MDGDDLCDEMETHQWEAMRTLGYSEDDINRAKAQKKWKEEVWLCSYMIQNKVWENDISCTYTDCYLRLALAQDGLSRRNEAIQSLRTAKSLWPDEHRLTLALAKLLFRADQKDESFLLCTEVFEIYNSGEYSADSKAMAEDAADAYYLAGWIKIHDDNHTKAYEVWKEGHLRIPSCPVLARQYGKRDCWDRKWEVTELAEVIIAVLLKN